MNWWVWLLLIVGAIATWYYYRVRGSALLEATISTSDGERYKVSFEKKNPDVNSEEYIRMILGSAAKMLHTIDPNDPNQVHVQKLLLESIQKLSQVDLNHKTDVMSGYGQQVSSTNGEPSSGDKKIVATLHTMNSTDRFVRTSIPYKWFEFQFLHSFLALIQETLPKLDESKVDRLKKSLGRMSEMYSEEGVDCSSVESLKKVPNKSFVGKDIDKI